MSVYKNEQGRSIMAGWYQTFLDGLRHPYSFQRVPTRYGETNVLITGPEHAPPLLCFHGVMGNAPSALSQVQDLVGTFRIIFPDTVGQPGRSAETRLALRGPAYGDWAADVLDGLGIDKVRILGVSMGGYIALKLAAQYPDRIEKLGLWVPGGLVTSGMVDGLRLMWGSLSYYLFPSDRRMQTMYELLFTDFDETWFRFYADSMQYLAMDRRMPEVAADDAFRHLTAPVLLLAQEHDRLFPADALVKRARQVFPNLVEAEVIPGFQHVPPFDPGRTAPWIERFRAFLL